MTISLCFSNTSVIRAIPSRAFCKINIQYTCRYCAFSVLKILTDGQEGGAFVVAQTPAIINHNMHPAGRIFVLLHDNAHFQTDVEQERRCCAYYLAALIALIDQSRLTVIPPTVCIVLDYRYH